MSEPAHHAMSAWIEREFAISGVLAAGGGVSNGPVFSAYASGELILAHNPKVWSCIAETIAQLAAKEVPVGELLWGFEEALLCTVQREDGAWLGVFTVARLNDESALALRMKLDAFRQQQFSDAN